MNSITRRRFIAVGARSAALLAWLSLSIALGAADLAPLPLTEPLTTSGDIASNLVAGVDRFLLREIDRSVERRAQFWKRDVSSRDVYAASVAPNRRRLAHVLGVRDIRPATNVFLAAGELGSVTPLARRARYAVFAVRWAAFGDVHGEGLLLKPAASGDLPGSAKGSRAGDREDQPRGYVVAIPDADQTPEQLVGLEVGTPPEQQFARRLAESGCVVVVPALVNRRVGQPKSPDGKRAASLSNREFIYRPAFEMGRHVIGYEVQKVLAAVDCLVHEREVASQTTPSTGQTIGVMGWGEGGMLALHAGALDERIGVVGVSGYFGRREDVWREPVDRNVFGLLEQFGDAEIACLIAPRSLIVEAARGPEVVVPPGTDAAPGQLTTPKVDDVRSEFERARKLLDGLQPPPTCALVVSGDGNGPYGSTEMLRRFLACSSAGSELASSDDIPPGTQPSSATELRHQRQMRELDRHTQWLLTESPYVRQRFMAKLDTSTPERYAQSSADFRELFYRDAIGRFSEPLLSPHARSRAVYDEPKWTGYEVVLDVFPDVIAYGLLLVPKDLKPGEKRPVVVCQHGLEGRPQDLIKGDHWAYHDFAAKLAEGGFITFAPQNLYLFGDRFRTLQRKANAIGKTLFSIIVPQHQQITDWMKGLPFVDPARIAFYGLSYGGKTAMRVPPLVTNYCLSICSGDFNDWVWKNASTRSPYSYVWTAEYEIFEFDLGSTFNYAEMSALIAPRPFMVERGHFDGVAPDETVAGEFAKVRFLYEAKLGLKDRCELEWFVGPHTINGKGTFDFLRRHLRWP